MLITISNNGICSANAEKDSPPFDDVALTAIRQT
jgi:hypothetical protein